jgi:hypothetical protein
MLPTTTDAVRAVLKSDPTITPADRTRILAAIRNHGRDSDHENAEPRQNRILRRSDVAKRLNRSLRFVDKLSAEGVIQKVTLAGRQRAVGFRSEDVERLLTGADL